MPELAEVLYFSRRWTPALDQKVLRVHLHDQKRVLRGVRTAQIRSTLRGQPLRAIQTHGKQMLFRFGSDRWLGVHLGMTGKLSAEPPDHLPGKHDHLVLYTRTRAGTLVQPAIAGLHAKIQKISKEAIRIIGRDWSDPPRTWLFLHRWEDGGKCPRCRGSLRRQSVGGRTTCWCPACQKAALPRRRSRS